MAGVVLDSGALSRLAERSAGSIALIEALRAAGLWPPVVPSVVLVESLRGHAGRDARVNRFLKTCVLGDAVPEGLARRAAWLRARARRGSAVDAIVVAFAEPAGLVLTQDPVDLSSLADYSAGVAVRAL
ncbi:MAG TPA: PIN domain-containing protein [Actinomycetota bacterium]